MEMRSEDGRWRAGYRILGFLGWFYAFALAGTAIVHFVIVGARLGGPGAAALKGITVAIAATAAVRIARRRLDHRSCGSLGLGGPRFADLAVGVLVAGVFAGVAVAVQVLAFGASVRFTGAEPANVLLVFIGTAAAIAWFEEIVFRGYLLQNAIEGLGRTRAVLLMTIVGGLVHTLNPHASLVSTTIVALIGLQHIATYLWSGRLWLSIGAHAGWNFFQGGVFGLAVSGRSNDSLFLVTPAGPGWMTGGAFGIEAGVFGVAWALGGAAVYWWWCRRGRPRAAERSASASGRTQPDPPGRRLSW